MSRSSAKERSRVQSSGRHISTRRTIENFGSWKHVYYLTHDCPTIPSLTRRFIGGKNSGRKLLISLEKVEIRKPTKRMLAKNENWWSFPLKLKTSRSISNYPNRKRIRRIAKNLITTEMSTYIEDQEEKQERKHLEEIAWIHKHYF